MKAVLTEYLTTISQTERKCLEEAHPDGNELQAKEAISNYTRDGLVSVETIFQTEIDKVSREFYIDANLVGYKNNSTDSDISALRQSLPLFPLKSSFMKQCLVAFKTIDNAVDAVKNSIIRIHKAFHVDPTSNNIVPIDFVPVVFPYFMEDLNTDSLDINNKTDIREFIQDIVLHTFEVQERFYENVLNQIAMASKIVALSIRTTTKLPLDVKEGLMGKVQQMLNKSVESIETVKANSHKELGKNLPEGYENSNTYQRIASICQEYLEKFAKDFNEIGEYNANNFITFFEMVYNL